MIVPFGLLFGVVAAEAGWGLAETMAMTVMVIAGASQFTALQLLSEHAPLLIVIATALAVNLRMAMYSAAMSQHVGALPFWKRALIAYTLTDQTFGVAINRFDREPQASAAWKVAYYFGVSVPVCVPWYVATWLGAVAGGAIPEGLALDFAVPITFLALVGAEPAQPAAPRRGSGVGRGVAGAGLAALQPLAPRRGGCSPWRPAPSSRARMERGSDERDGADLGGDPRPRGRDLPDPLLLHRPRRRPQPAAVGAAAAPLRAGGGDAGDRRARSSSGRTRPAASPIPRASSPRRRRSRSAR